MTFISIGNTCINIDNILYVHFSNVKRWQSPDGNETLKYMRDPENKYEFMSAEEIEKESGWKQIEVLHAFISMGESEDFTQLDFEGFDAQLLMAKLPDINS